MLNDKRTQPKKLRDTPDILATFPDQSAASPQISQQSASNHAVTSA
jgi:hypothetical protein